MGLETRPPHEGCPATDAGEAAPAESRAASPRPETQEPTNEAAPELPPIAAKADDLGAIKAAVDDAASVGGGLWLSYLFVLFYLAVAAGAVTHADLFLEKPVKLPFLTDIELPLLAFFFLAPILFIVVHAYTLVHLVMLTEKAKRYHQALHDPERKVRDAERENLQWQLPSNIFIQFLAGPSGLRRGLFGWLLRAIGWVTLVIAPILLLLMMQVQFLPFHSSFITWTQRLALVADLALIWWLWRKILSGREVDAIDPMGSLAAFEIGILLSFLAIAFSWAVATFPGEWQEDLLARWDRAEWAITAHNALFNAAPDDITRRRFPFSSALVLPGLNIYEGVGIDDPEKVKWRDFVFLARGRDLRGAIFDLASLLKVDFNGADLRDASLNGAQLQGASLGAAQLQGASLGGAQLQGASLDNAQLQGAWLSDLQFLYSPRQLQPGGWLPSPQFQGMSLRAAQLQGASLAGAQLQGASLVRANLQGASLGAAIVDATDLSGAYLWRTHRFEGLWLPPMDATNLMSGESWLPEWEAEGRTPRPWDTTAYQALRNMIESLPVGNNRDSALSRIERLDCANPDPAFASCDRSAGPTPEAKAWREALEATRVNEQAYEEALAYALFSLVCLSNDAMYVVRGEGFLARLEGAGTAASGLIDDLINTDSKHCPDAPALTSDDRVNLLHIKENIEEVKAQQKSLF